MLVPCFAEILFFDPILNPAFNRTLSIKFLKVFPTGRSNMPQSACSSHISYFVALEYTCWNVDAIPGIKVAAYFRMNLGNLGNWNTFLCLVVWMKMHLDSDVSCNPRRDFCQHDGWIFASHRLESENGILLAVCKMCTRPSWWQWWRWDDRLTGEHIFWADTCKGYNLDVPPL